ncbi:DUF883 family protein [Methylocapsa palsarum]|uniref:Membrane-anchored ribosome-binding protein, inhibits growth in stationary phase, ElaB/YqjD/DUF883 family n=1 Tax=Methylocapsa palsarum TaxID=1612308 RepID=A0A1I3XGE0_9HYPH|nr:DUF883 family protein [Methylocapsa palsarum]SFK18116.1 Membrane-anchored ribosome-binding protein, inhibits growth in stationary phase, ElaB/YqjD/DUF883 family [Methylocapsa palsarum]
MSAIKSINEAIQEVPGDLASLRDEIAKLTITVTDLVSKQAAETTDTVMGTVGNARRKLSDTTEDAQDRINGIGAELESTIERNPLVAVTIAFSFGLFMGMLSRGLAPRSD